MHSVPFLNKPLSGYLLTFKFYSNLFYHELYMIYFLRYKPFGTVETFIETNEPRYRIRAEISYLLLTKTATF